MPCKLRTKKAFSHEMAFLRSITVKNKKASSHEEGFLGLLILHHPPAKFLTETLETVFLHSYNEV